MYSFSLSGFLHEGGTPVLTVSSLGAAFILSTSAIEWPTEPPLAAPARVPRMIAVVRHHHAQLWPQGLFLLALVIGTAGNQHGAHSCNGLRFNTPHASTPFVPSLALSAIDIAIIGNLAPPRRRTLRNVNSHGESFLACMLSGSSCPGQTHIQQGKHQPSPHVSGLALRILNKKIYAFCKVVCVPEM